jgi:CHAD domain-containing protein
MSSRVEWKPSELATADARRILPVLVREYFEAGRKLTPESTAKVTHRFRLKTKRLRYTLDAFVELYGHGLKRRSASLKAIQNLLGEVNDCAVLLKESGNSLPPEVRTWLEERGQAARAEFLRYWKEEFDAPGEDKKWERYLTRSDRLTKQAAS